MRPNFLGTRTEFSNMFERPIQNGQCMDSTPRDVRLMRHRAHVLHQQLKGFVQRYVHKIMILHCRTDCTVKALVLTKYFDMHVGGATRFCARVSHPRGSTFCFCE